MSGLSKEYEKYFAKEAGADRVSVIDTGDEHFDLCLHFKVENKSAVGLFDRISKICGDIKKARQNAVVLDAVLTLRDFLSGHKPV